MEMNNAGDYTQIVNHGLPQMLPSGEIAEQLEIIRKAVEKIAEIQGRLAPPYLAPYLPAPPYAPTPPIWGPPFQPYLPTEPMYPWTPFAPGLPFAGLPGCKKCGIGADGKPYGYVCGDPACPSAPFTYTVSNDLPVS